MELLYTTNVDSDTPIMWIDKHIGMDSEDGPGIMGDLFKKELLYLDSLKKKSITVKINSIGGVVLDGYEMYEAILNSNTAVDTYCYGIAASTAGNVFQAGRKRIMADYATLMYHNPMNATDNTLKAFRDSIIKMVAGRNSMTEQKVAYMMDRTTFIDAAEAKREGLCDDVVESVGLNTKWVRKEATVTNIYREAQKIQNKAGDGINITAMSEKAMLLITAKLNLNADAQPESILSAIKAIENKADEAEVARIKTENELRTLKNSTKEALDKAKADMDEAENKFTAMKASYDAMKVAHDAMAAEKTAVEDKTCLDKAVNMVKEIAKTGRIENKVEVINQWAELAKKDFDGIKGMLEKIPINKEAVQLSSIINKQEGTGTVYDASIIMANIQMKKEAARKQA